MNNKSHQNVEAENSELEKDVEDADDDEKEADEDVEDGSEYETDSNYSSETESSNISKPSVYQSPNSRIPSNILGKLRIY